MRRMILYFLLTLMVVIDCFLLWKLSMAQNGLISLIFLYTAVMVGSIAFFDANYPK